jgi:NitT/TauT family transport system substrate-binding protein
VALWAAALCGGRGSTDAESAKPTKLRVVKSEHVTGAPFFIAEEDGFFADQGLAIEALTFRDNAAALPGLAAGDVDVYVSTIAPNMLNIIARTDDVKIVLARSGQNPAGCSAYGLMAKRELVESGRLRVPADLRGLRVGTERTSSNFYVISTLLASAGLTLDDIKASHIPQRLEPEAFERDLLDVTSSAEPWMTRMVDGGSAVVWLPTRDIVPDFQYHFMLFGPSLLRGNREAGRQFVTAYLRGVRQYIKEGKTDRIAGIIAKRLRLDVDFVRRMCWPYLPADGHVSLESLDRYQRWALREGLVDRVLGADEVWDRSFVDHANRVLDGAK